MRLRLKMWFLRSLIGLLAFLWERLQDLCDLLEDWGETLYGATHNGYLIRWNIAEDSYHLPWVDERRLTDTEVLRIVLDFCEGEGLQGSVSDVHVTPLP